MASAIAEGIDNDAAPRRQAHADPLRNAADLRKKKFDCGGQPAASSFCTFLGSLATISA